MNGLERAIEEAKKLLEKDGVEQLLLIVRTKDGDLTVGSFDEGFEAHHAVRLMRGILP